MTPRDQNMQDMFILWSEPPHSQPRLQEPRETYSDHYCLSMQNTSSQSCDMTSLFALADKIQFEFAVLESVAGRRN
jgi:hypothetical protein